LKKKWKVNKIKTEENDKDLIIKKTEIWFEMGNIVNPKKGSDIRNWKNRGKYENTKF
jgi:hypothetical protein